MNKIWKLRENEVDEKKIEQIEKKYNLSFLISKILAEKNLNEKELEKYLNPTRKDFYDPRLIPDMEKAADRIVKAINKKEKIIIYGDYDADGITSTTILKKFLKDVGIDSDTYIPNRINEGYGLNKKAINEIASKNFNLIITVDCGITSIDEVDYSNNLGIDVIITDHHETIEKLPNAIAVVDCKRKDSKYPFSGLAGCGIAFKLIQMISIKLDLKEDSFLKYLDIVCIGTISDIVPLIDENRVITMLGLKLVKQTSNIGLRALIRKTGIKEINSVSITFAIAPRINACGRMGHQDTALKLFLSNDPIEISKLIEEIEGYNRQRQDIEKKIYSEALELLEHEDLDEITSIILGHKNWHSGVIGIVSSKITERYFKPSILVCFDGENSRGSGRSIEGFDLHEAIIKCSSKLKSCGGHSMAIGVNLAENNFNDFKKEFLEYSDKNIDKNLKPQIQIDEEFINDYLNVETVRQLKMLEPFGEENKEPLFIFKNLKIDSIRTISEGKHLRLRLNGFDAIGFNLGNYIDNFQIGSKIDIVGNVSINDYNGYQNIQFILKDLRLSI